MIGSGQARKLRSIGGGIVGEWALRNYDQNSYILTRDDLTASKRLQKKLKNHQKFNPDNPPGRACCLSC
jgi:hypothetical protein